jgi:hypothetical protein
MTFLVIASQGFASLAYSEFRSTQGWFPSAFQADGIRAGAS